MVNHKIQFSWEKIWAACLESLLFSLLFAGLTIGTFLFDGDWYLLLRVILLFAFLLSVMYLLSDYGQPLVFQALGFFIPAIVVSLFRLTDLGYLIFWLPIAGLCSVLILYFNKAGNWLALGWQLTLNSLSLVLFHFLLI